MPINHALVVDDSRAARFALQKLLEEQGLDVSLCVSGEEALDYLKKNQPDVIFMDHTMPGMDGLEAVSAIKANPKTATIPVMMYTTREGEVYVGQARALGAVGVMPKNVQPNQLFETLTSLGLVTDRRIKAEQAANESASQGEAETVNNQAIGISVQNLVSRILEDQHMTLRSDILRSQRTFARQVAKEFVMEQARNEEMLAEQSEQAVGGGSRLLSFSLMVVAVVGLFFAYQFKGQRDDAYIALQDKDRAQADFMATEVAALQGAIDEFAAADDSLRRFTVDALEWAVNEGNHSDVGAFPFNGDLRDKTLGLIERLTRIGFMGEVVMTSHLGKFCLQVSDLGGYVLANAELPVAQCDYVGHPEEESSSVADRLSVPFSRLYAQQLDQDVRLELVALTGTESADLLDYPINAMAGEWNRVAYLNNRVEIQIQARN